MEFTNFLVIYVYARWVEKQTVSTPEELLAMREDLYGWYVLENDINLADIEWIPVGTYVSHYEYLNPTWWLEAFHGEFDGAGHTISNLSLKTTEFFEDDNSTRKGIRNGVAAMFGAVGSNASIHDLTLDSPEIDFKSGIHYAYVAALAGMVEGGSFSDCHVKNLTYHASITDEANMQETATDGIYASLSGLICGIWDGVLENCSVDGSMEVELTSVKSHGGNVFVGAVMGDGYIPVMNCTGNVAIHCSYADQAEGDFVWNEAMDNGFSIMCGGNVGLAAALISSPSEGSILIENHSHTGNAAILCEGSYGMLLGDPAEAAVASEYTGTVQK